jgi:hypothetical protein
MDAEELFILITLNMRLVFLIGYCAILVKKFVVVFFLLGESPAYEFYVLTFFGTHSFFTIFIGGAYATYEDGTECSETSAYKI